MTAQNLHHFGRGLEPSLVDQSAFQFEHDLVNHPAMSLESLARVVPRLPRENVFYSSGRVDKNANFDRAHLDHKNGLDLEETMETLRTSNSYVMVRKPEFDPSFRPLFEQLFSEIETLLALRGWGRKVVDPQLFLFLASPGAVTPFHIDRYSTMLLQFRGSKEVWVYPSGDERLVPPDIEEEFVVVGHRRPQYNPALDSLAKRFEFSPGQGIHIPVLAPHHVKNGEDDVSVSLSIIFNSRASSRQLGAIHFNHAARTLLKPFGYAPIRAGQKPNIDAVKANVVRTFRAAEWRGRKLAARMGLK